MAIKTNNKIFKSLRENKTLKRVLTQRSANRIKERQEKEKQLKISQLLKLKKESEIKDQQRIKRAIASTSSNSNITLNRTVNGIITSNKVTRQTPLGKVVKTGMTTENEGHSHRWTMYDGGLIIIHDAKHPEDSRIKHNHDYVGVWKKGTITWNQSNCYNDNPNSRNSCETLYGYSGAEMHKHKIQFSI